MANVIEEMVGTSEADAAATESGGSVATESGGAVATESGGARRRRDRGRDWQFQGRDRRQDGGDGW